MTNLDKVMTKEEQKQNRIAIELVKAEKKAWRKAQNKLYYEVNRLKNLDKQAAEYQIKKAMKPKPEPKVLSEREQAVRDAVLAFREEAKAKARALRRQKSEERLAKALADFETYNALQKQRQEEREAAKLIAKVSCVYLMKNKNNSRCYIGSTIDLVSRQRAHFSFLKSNTHYAKQMQADYNEDPTALEVSILETCSKDQLRVREQHFIDSMKPEYNSCPVSTSCLGLKRTDETKAKIRAVKLGKRRPPMGDDWKAKIGAANRACWKAKRMTLKSNIVGENQ